MFKSLFEPAFAEKAINASSRFLLELGAGQAAQPLERRLERSVSKSNARRRQTDVRFPSEQLRPRPPTEFLATFRSEDNAAPPGRRRPLTTTRR